MKRSAHSHQGNEAVKQEVQTRLKRIEGQIRGISAMWQDGAYCQDILNQIASARSALAGLQQVIFHEHVETCIADRMVKDTRGAIEEIISILKKFR